MLTKFVLGFTLVATAAQAQAIDPLVDQYSGRDVLADATLHQLSDHPLVAARIISASSTARP
jgi:hypothetical protein